MRTLLVKNFRIAALFYIVIEVLIYGSFLYIDIINQGSYLLSNYLKFIGIIMCLLFTLFLPVNKMSQRDLHLLKTAMFFTVISDLFILILDYYTLGLLTFCIVQFTYLIRLDLWKNEFFALKKLNIIHKIIRNLIFCFFVLLLFFIFDLKLDMLLILTSFYLISILFNVIDAVREAIRTRGKQAVFFAVGMVLFLLCDINVGIFNIPGFINISKSWFITLYDYATVAMWLFYLPAQVFIAMSGYNKESMLNV